MRWFLSVFGSGLRNGLVAIGALAFVGTAISIADYTATQGTGTTFASIVISLKHYMANVLCDPTVGEGQCAGIVAPSGTAASATGGSLKIQFDPLSPGLISPGQQTMSASAPVAIASDQSSVAVKLNTTPSIANGNAIVPTQAGAALSTTNGGYTNLLQGNAALSSGNPLPVSLPAGDPCVNGTKVYTPISQTANTQLVALTSGKIIYVCHAFYNGSDAENISLVEGTGSVCASNTAAVVGGATANAGNNFAANSGAAIGNGASSVAATATVSHALCLFQNGTGRVAGVIVTVTQ